MAAAADSSGPQHGPPVLLLDVMDTLVYDPFFQDMPRFFNMPFKELLASKHPTAWLQVRTGAWPAGCRCRCAGTGRAIITVAPFPCFLIHDLPLLLLALRRSLSVTRLARRSCSASSLQMAASLTGRPSSSTWCAAPPSGWRWLGGLMCARPCLSACYSWGCVEGHLELPPAHTRPTLGLPRRVCRPTAAPPHHSLQADCYRYMDGMEALLQRLSAGGASMHAFSNYPSWWRMIEGKLELSRYLEWTFVSCQAPIKVLRCRCRCAAAA